MLNLNSSMESKMNTTKKLSFLASVISALLLTGCGDAETTIIEQDPIVDESGDDHDHDHDDGYTIESAGRLSVLDAESNTLAIFDLDDNSLLDTFSTTYSGSALATSAGGRFAVITSRTNDLVEFVDGGLWREDHVEHLHDYEEAPAMTTFALTGSRPTHVVGHDGQLAVFFDGDADSSSPASVQVVTDTNIAAGASSVNTLTYDVNMHGVAEPTGDMLISTVRRDDSETTSANPVLPDSVGVYHLHDGVYEQEQLFAGECPDLHGAAMNDSFAVFGCSDGVLVLSATDEVYSSSKIANIEAVGDMRIGSVYTHHDAASFVGIASGHGGGAAVIMAIHADDGEMEEIDWEPETDATPVSYGFSYDGVHFLILDSQGYLSVMAAHDHDDHMHWELEARVDISDEDISTMPDGLNFSMTVSQSAGTVYVADPIASHIVIVDIESAAVTGEIEPGFVPASLSWLGIAAEHE